MAEDPPDVTRAELSEYLRAARADAPSERKPASADYIREKLRRAASSITSQADDVTIQRRLYSAIVTLLASARLSADDFQRPGDSKLFAKIAYRVAEKQAATDEGDLAATVLEMDENEAQELADDVLELHRRFDPLERA